MEVTAGFRTVNPRPSGRVIWLTGLSGAGKTTLAKALAFELPNSIVLDGDELRVVLGSTDSGFDADSRKKLAMSYAKLAALLAMQGFTVIVATISLFHAIHAWNRENVPNYLEVFLDIPRELCQQRDPKGLYAAEKAGTIAQMAGGSTEVELPLKPHLRFNGSESVARCVAEILDFLARPGNNQD